MNKEEAEIVASALGCCQQFLQVETNLLNATGEKPQKKQYIDKELLPNINEAYEIIKREYYNTYKNK